jgi:two-component system, LytTR family, response regulator
MMIQAVIIDDDAINISLLRGLLKTYCAEIEVVATATNIDDGIKAIYEHQPALLFLDVEIHDQTGFDILAVIGKLKVEVIMITAYDRYAIKAIKFDVADYLLKPIKIDELIRAVEKCSLKINERIEKIKEPLIQKIDCLAVHNKNSIEFIPYDEVIHLTANGGYTDIITTKRKTVSSRSLKEIEIYLPEHIFVRVHHSYIVNRHKILKLLKVKHGSLIMSNDDEIPISESRKKEVSDLLGFNG